MIVQKQFNEFATEVCEVSIYVNVILKGIKKIDLK